MNNTLIYIQELDKKIESLKEIISEGTYLAAGIRLSITIGSGDPDHHDLVVPLGIYSDLPEIMESILKGMVEAREVYISNLRSEYLATARYLTKEDERVK